ncbi:GNAT family N-acetyltransferase [Pelagibius marinus]|uniref:GNAT family N-acetyltransferase n=1 Tax=Pelagibius marinus TaxID=2762760 RepID=UPI0018722BFE|nr:N-acetyltransferase [Pelagibius marinus]
MQIRETSADDLPAVMRLQEAAFGQAEEAELTRAILADPTAAPTLSLLAQDDGKVLGHVLFSRVRLTGPASDCAAAILAPLAVLPEAQGRGVGGRLIEAGLARLRERGVALVFVLGDPAFYNRFGFQAAGRQGLAAPYPIPEEHAEAWRVQALNGVVLGRLRGSVICGDSLMRPELWRE